MRWASAIFKCLKKLERNFIRFSSLDILSHSLIKEDQYWECICTLYLSFSNSQINRTYMFARRDLLSNPSRHTIELIECFHFAPPGSHGCTILLPPGGRCLFPASKFSDRNRYAGRPSSILVYVNHVRASQSLTPEQFKRFVKLSFYVDDDGRLTIRGVESEFSDLCRFW